MTDSPAAKASACPECSAELMTLKAGGSKHCTRCSWSEAGERQAAPPACSHCDGTGLALNMAGEPDECLACKGNTVEPVSSQEETYLALVNEVIAKEPPTRYTYVAQNHDVEHERRLKYARRIGIEVAKRLANETTELERCQRALLEVRTALGLHRDSEDDLLEVIGRLRTARTTTEPQKRINYCRCKTAHPTLNDGLGNLVCSVCGFIPAPKTTENQK